MSTETAVDWPKRRSVWRRWFRETAALCDPGLLSLVAAGRRKCVSPLPPGRHCRLRAFPCHANGRRPHRRLIAPNRTDRPSSDRGRPASRAIPHRHGSAPSADPAGPALPQGDQESAIPPCPRPHIERHGERPGQGIDCANASCPAGTSRPVPRPCRTSTHDWRICDFDHCAAVTRPIRLSACPLS